MFRQAAMEMGDGARALKFYQTALQHNVSAGGEEGRCKATWKGAFKRRPVHLIITMIKWIRTISRQAAMEMGDGARALKFYQTALRADPDQAQVGREYKKLKVPSHHLHTTTVPGLRERERERCVCV